MFNKTKRKIVFAVTFSLLALMTVTLATIYLSNMISVRRESIEMLKTYAERFTLEETAPGGEAPPEQPVMPEPPKDDRAGKNEPEFRLSTFYSVAYSSGGEIISINNGDNGLKSEAELTSLASSILKKGKTSGATGGTVYLVDEREEYTLVAFLDGTINENNRKTLFKQMLIIGGIATAVLLALSVIVAEKIVRPLEENDLRQKRFVSDAGHELKTPIAVTAANVELLKRQSGASEWLDNIEYENGRMCELVTQLLSLSRAEKADMAKEILDFSSVCERETLAFESLAYENGKRINCDVAPGISLGGNANQLRQLVSILIDNALSYGAGEEITVSLKREKHGALLAVSNPVNDFKAESITKLFDRFYRADESRGGDKHYGLGLSIAKAIVAAHGGKIACKLQGEIITFTAFIPISQMKIRLNSF